MKNFRNQRIIVSLVVGVLCITSCEKDNEELQNDQQEVIQTEPIENAILPTEVSLKSVEVARIQKNGHDYRFIAVGEDGGILVRERLYGNAKKNAEKFTVENGDRPIDIFMKITDASIPIPESMTKTESVTKIKGLKRKISYNSSPLAILDSEYNLATPISPQLFCQHVTESTFSSIHCEAPLTSTANNMEFCDEDLRSSLTRVSKFGEDWEHSDCIEYTTNFCGNTQLKFYSWRSNGSKNEWMLDLQIDYYGNGLEAGTYIYPLETERKVIRTSVGAGGSFRSFTRFKDLYGFPHF